MEFDRSKILTVVTADQAKVGQKGWFSSNIENLAYLVREEQPKELLGVNTYNAVHAFKTVFQNHALFYPAPEPTYRPFKNAEEFKPYRDKWCIDNLKGRFKIDWHSDTHIYEYGNSFITWEEAFGKYKFEDGTAFGIKEEV